VIAQDVQAVFPHLVERGPDGYLRVDYGGLAIEVARSIAGLGDRTTSLEAFQMASDAKAKVIDDPGARESNAVPDPVKAALANLRSGELRPIDLTALVGTLVEAVKELDGRLTEIEQRRDASECGSGRSPLVSQL